MAGIVGTVASAVMACKATTKATKVVEETKKDIKIMHEALEEGETRMGEPYSEDAFKKELASSYVHTGIEIVKLYAPAVCLGALSLTSIVASNNILRKRNVALAAAYATVDKGFKEYRNRVVERFGKEVDKELRYNLKATQIQETVVDENGKEKVVTKTIYESDEPKVSDFAKIFDEQSPYFQKDADANRFFLQSQQAYANNLLQARKYLFLNDVYKLLGFEPTKAGQVVGWIYDPNNRDRDNFVDFGLCDFSRPSVKEFMQGHERAVILDFNVDGNILDNAPIERS